MISQFPPFFPVLQCPLGLGELQACPFPDVVFQPLPLSALSSSPFHSALQDGFGQTWDMTIPLQFVCLMMVRRSSCGPIAWWILARTSSLVTWPLYKMCRRSYLLCWGLVLQYDNSLLQYSTGALILCMLELRQFFQHWTDGLMLCNLRHLEQADQHRQSMLHVSPLGTHAAPPLEAVPQYPGFLNEVLRHLNGCAVL